MLSIKSGNLVYAIWLGSLGVQQSCGGSPDGPLTSLAMPPKMGRAARRFMGGLGSKSASEPGEEGSIAPRPGRRMLGCLQKKHTVLPKP